MFPLHSSFFGVFLTFYSFCALILNSFFFFLLYGVHIGQLPPSLPGLIPTSMPFPVVVFAIGFHNFAAAHAGGVYNLVHMYL